MPKEATDTLDNEIRGSKIGDEKISVHVDALLKHLSSNQQSTL
jgi:hypothetical protein